MSSRGSEETRGRKCDLKKGRNERMEPLGQVSGNDCHVELFSDEMMFSVFSCSSG